MILCIEGLDCCGKATQSKMLYENLKEEGFKLLSFPNYGTKGAILVESYLNGDYGKDASTINPYQASTFFAMDRLHTYLTEMKPWIDQGGHFVLDRYATSNLLYQASKIKDKAERQKFNAWINDFEYEKLGIPKADVVFFLKVNYDTFINLMAERNDNKHRGNDIHEDNKNYLREVYDISYEVAVDNGWVIVDCDNGHGGLLSREEISNRIISSLRK